MVDSPQKVVHEEDDESTEPLARSKTTWASPDLPAHAVRHILDSCFEELDVPAVETESPKKRRLAQMVNHINTLSGQDNLIFDGLEAGQEQSSGMYLNELVKLLPQDGTTELQEGSALERSVSTALYFHFTKRWKQATNLLAQKSELGAATEWGEKDRPVCNLAMPRAVMEGTEFGPIGIPGHYINGSRIPPLAASAPALPSYVATQHPLPSTVGDFWWTVLERRPACIVMLNEHDYDRAGDAHALACARYWLPEALSPETGLTLEQRDCHAGAGGVVVRTLQVSLRGEVQDRGAFPRRPSHTVRHLSMPRWPDTTAPPLGGFITCWRVFQALLAQAAVAEGAPEVFVHCTGGIGRTGVFIAADMGARMAACKSEGRSARLSCSGPIDLRRGAISPDIVIGHLRSCRVNMVQSASQYFFLHYVHAHLVAHLRSPAPPRPSLMSGSEVVGPALSRAHSQ